MAEKRTEVARQEERGLARREPFLDIGNPFRMIERRAFDRVCYTHSSESQNTTLRR
jgi:hypothetical protein